MNERSYPATDRPLTPAEQREALADWLEQSPTDLIAFGAGAKDVVRPDYLLASDVDWIIEQCRGRGHTDAAATPRKPVAWRWRHGPSGHWAYSEERPEGPSIHLFKVEPLYVGAAQPSRITGAANQVEEAAGLIWNELCPGMVMGAADLPHYEAAAKAVLAISSTDRGGT